MSESVRDSPQPPPSPVQQAEASSPSSPTSPSYINMAAKTVANIRRLQENIAGGSASSAMTGGSSSITVGGSATAGGSSSFMAGGSSSSSITQSWVQMGTVDQERCCVQGAQEDLQQPPDNVESLTNSLTTSSLLSCSSPSPRLAAVSPPPSPRPVTSSPLSTRDPNWQSFKNSVRDRNSAMFNNPLMSDIHFLVGPSTTARRVPAHKYVLATGSTVFFAMFYGGLADPESQEVSVPDVDPEAFLSLLRYLYCDEICLEPDNVLATLYAAKKYIVPHLARECVRYLETSLTARNACLLLSQSRLFEEPELMQRCWDVIDAQAEIALKSEGFTDIDFQTLETILARETLNCPEVTVFSAAQDWAGAEARRRGEEPTPSTIREILGSAMFSIRFPAMTVEDFADSAAQSGMLSLQETKDIFLNFTARQKPALEYPVRPRIGMKSQICHRFQSSAYRSNQWRYRGRCDSIQFCVDRRIFIVGFGLYGSSSGSADYSVRIELKHGGKILAANTQNFFSDGSSNTFHVFFDHPVQIEADKSYTASAVLDGAELSYFGQEGLSEVVVGEAARQSRVTFMFQCSSESTNGTGVQGGQIPEIIFYGPSPPT